jgi:hypothetical protein
VDRAGRAATSNVPGRPRAGADAPSLQPSGNAPADCLRPSQTAARRASQQAKPTAVRTGAVARVAPDGALNTARNERPVGLLQPACNQHAPGLRPGADASGRRVPDTDFNPSAISAADTRVDLSCELVAGESQD